MRYDDSYWKDVDDVIQCIPDHQELYGHSFFISGGTGMIGSSLIEVLLEMNRKYQARISIVAGVRDTDKAKERFLQTSDWEGLSFVQYDALSDFQLDFDPDFIIHGAGNAHPSFFVTEPVETMISQLNGLNVLLKAAAERKGIRRVLYISSGEVYGRKNDEFPYSEENYSYVDILNPRASYPSAKRAGETLCAAYGNEYGVDTVIVRPGHIYGPGITDSDSRASAVFSRNARNSEPIIMKSSGLQKRSYMYSLDCVSAILTVLVKGEKGQAYNLSNPASVVTIREMAEAFAKAGSVEILYEDPSDQEVLGYNLMDHSILNSEKLRSLGWKGCFDLEKGTAATLRYLK